MGSLEAQGADICAKLARIRLLAMDVDGVLTDGTIGYDGQGAQQKRFHVADGLGLVVLGQEGIAVAWVTGRRDAAVERRAAELSVPYLLQGVRDKGRALRQLAAQLELAPEEIAYIGDDWNDLTAFAVAGVRLAVANAAEEVKAQADLVTTRSGGLGAVREVCESILEAHGRRGDAVAAYVAALCQGGDVPPSGQ
ncbi:MAG TPA: HAD hydrolase family protein [Chthonomonadaceae bacterium]|nr:HAD hydrolase family protein [Chthonomonadaceae bacterium]